MKERKPILIETARFILKEEIINSDGSSTWSITNPKNKNSLFYVHCYFSGSLYISFLKGIYCNNDFVLASLRKLCEILLNEYSILTINICYTNKALINLCRKIGFRKQHNTKYLYYLKSVK